MERARTPAAALGLHDDLGSQTQGEVVKPLVSRYL